MDGYDPSRILYLPGRRLYGYWMLLENIPGVLAKVTNVFAKKGVNLVKVLVTSVEEGADSLFYCDFTDVDVKPEKLAEDFRRLKEVRDIKHIEPVIPGLLIDNIHFPIMISKGRYVLCGEDGFRGFVKGVRDEFGSAGEALLYYAGLDVGEGMWKGMDYYTTVVKDKIEIFKRLFMNTGYGKMDIDINIIGEEADVIVYDSIECSQGIGSENPYSHYIRGIIAGVFKNIFGGEVDVKEMKCIAVGDEYCEFKVVKR